MKKNSKQQQSKQQSKFQQAASREADQAPNPADGEPEAEGNRQTATGIRPAVGNRPPGHARKRRDRRRGRCRETSEAFAADGSGGGLPSQAAGLGGIVAGAGHHEGGERDAAAAAGAVSQRILGPFGLDSDLQRWGWGLAARGKKRAKRRSVVALARELAVVLHAIWLKNEEWKPFRDEQAAAASGAVAGQ